MRDGREMQPVTRKPSASRSTSTRSRYSESWYTASTACFMLPFPEVVKIVRPLLIIWNRIPGYTTDSSETRSMIRVLSTPSDFKNSRRAGVL